MNNYNYATIIFAFFGLTSFISAQEILKVEEAVQIALENNCLLYTSDAADE